jgi:putative FmdB family regulatory protein
MPIYEYVCDKCGKLNDVLQKLNDPPPERCDGCGTEGSLTKIVSRSSFVLRGGGWYSDLYSSSKKDSSSEGAKEKDGAAKKAEPAPSTGGAKPASATESSSSGSPGKK